MNIISCDGCGVVLDAKKLKFPTDIYSDKVSFELDDSKAGWNGYDYVPIVKCPVCGELIFKEES